MGAAFVATMQASVYAADKAQGRARDAFEALQALEKEAGIFEHAEKIRSELAHYEFVYDVGERWSDERNAAIGAEEENHRALTTYRLRKLYFAVENREMRKRLIAQEREVGDRSVDYWRAELDDAVDGCGRAAQERQFWWIGAGIWGVLCIGFGYAYFGMPGALGGLLIGYIVVRMRERDALRARDTAIKRAETARQGAEGWWHEARNEPHRFSKSEAASGDPGQPANWVAGS
jgi:hypothetical protein